MAETLGRGETLDEYVEWLRGFVALEPASYYEVAFNDGAMMVLEDIAHILNQPRPRPSWNRQELMERFSRLELAHYEP